MKMHELKDLTNSRTARLAVEAGFSSLRDACNGLSLWSCDVADVELFFEEQIHLQILENLTEGNK